MLRVQVRTKLNPDNYSRKITNNSKFWLATAVSYWRIISPYTPMDTGALMRNVVIKPRRIFYKVPYAKENYYKNTKPRKDKHPKATRKWDKVAMKTEKHKLINEMKMLAKKFEVLK